MTTPEDAALADLTDRLTLEEFPRSAKYDPRWVVDNAMGPNPLWLMEWLCEAVDLRPGMRVLDLGCGRALTSVFLAREFGVQVVAADLWIDPADNARRIVEAGVADRVLPVRAEAHDLPFAQGWFDAVLSVDAYHYFGTDDLYLGYVSQFLAPGGRLGIAVPGLAAELDEVPEHAREFWEWEFVSFHSPQWWRRLWSLTGLVEVEVADWLDDGWQHWLRWQQASLDHGTPAWQQRWREPATREAEMLRTDAGRTFGFTRAICRLV